MLSITLHDWAHLLPTIIGDQTVSYFHNFEISVPDSFFGISEYVVVDNLSQLSKHYDLLRPNYGQPYNLNILGLVELDSYPW